MAELSVAARLALAVAFAWSAGVKLARPRAFAAALTAFEVPAAPTVARFLPPVEAGVAVVLLTVPDDAWPALAAAALLTVFSVAVAVNLTRGNRAPCPCFGIDTDRALSGMALARNAYLLVVAGLAAGSTDGASTAAAVVTAAVLVALTLFVVRRLG